MPVIVGPTAGGKSALSVAVARALAARGHAAEIVSADSVQIFRGLDIGSAKPTADEMAGIPHHLIDVVEPEERFTVHDWLACAERAIGEIRTRGAVPVVVGGTNLYIKALLEGLFEGPEPDETIRDALRALTQADRRAELERVDPAASERIHPNDERRTVRALEVFRQTGVPISEHQRQWDTGVRTDAGLFGLLWNTEAINRRINARVKAMMSAGLLDEVVALRSRLGPQSREALGYKQLLGYLDRGDATGGYTGNRGAKALEDAVERIKIETRRFAKNQRTWLRRLATSSADMPYSGRFDMDRISQDPSAVVETAKAIVDRCLAGSEGGSE